VLTDGDLVEVVGQFPVTINISSILFTWLKHKLFSFPFCFSDFLSNHLLNYAQINYISDVFQIQLTEF